LGFFLFRRLKDQAGYLFCVCWIVSVVVFISFMRYTDARYGMALVPPSIILSMLCLSLVSRVSRAKYVVNVVVAGLVAIHMVPGTVWASRDVRGFGEVAGFVAEDRSCVSVLYDGYFDSNFVLNMRVEDPVRRVFVFRASKVVFSTKMIPALGYRELIAEEKEFYDLLEQYGIKYVVQEEKDSMNTPANKRLRSWMQEPAFRLARTYRLLTRGFGSGSDDRLLVYEYLGYSGEPIDAIELDMPMLGRKIRVQIGSVPEASGH